MLRTLLILVFALLANVFCHANTQIEGDWSFISIKNDTKKIDLPISK